MSEMIERTAKLFESGEYADRGLTVTNDDLDRLAGSFAEVPVKIEHTQTPFDGALGQLRSIGRIGKELFGKIAFTPEAWALASKAGAKKLSIAISRDLSRITEVSLVSNPRVLGAAVFDDHIEYVTDTDWGGDENANATTEEVIRMADQDKSTSPEVATFTQADIDKAKAEGLNEGKTEFRAEVQTLAAGLASTRRELAETKAQAEIDALKTEGKITPAMEPFAKELLLQSSTSITFGEGQTTVATLFRDLVKAMPRVVTFGETGKRGPDALPELTADEKMVFEKMGVPVDDAAKRFTELKFGDGGAK